jgi:hypothetical protein
MTVTATPTPKAASPGRWRRVLRRLLGPLLLCGLLLLFVLLTGVAWIAAHFNPQTQSRQLAEQIQARTGYRLSAAASPRLTFAPRLGLAWGPLLLEASADGATPGAPARRVATAQSLHLTLDAWALLGGDTQVRRVRIDGLNLWPAPDRRYALPVLELNIARMSTALPATPPGASSEGASNASYAATPSGTSAASSGTASSAAAQAADTTTDANPVPAPSHMLDLQATVLDATGQGLPLRLQGQIGLDLSRRTTTGQSGTTRGQQAAYRLQLQGSFDQTSILLDASRGSASPLLRFDLALGALDLDRYQARPLAQPSLQTAAWQAQTTLGTAATHAPRMPASTTVTDAAGPASLHAVTTLAAITPNAPGLAAGPGALLHWARDLGLDRQDVQGTLRVASLRFMNLRLSHLRLQAWAHDLPAPDNQGRKRRRIDLDPLTASLYDGGVHGALRIRLDGDAPAATSVAAKLDLRDVRIAPLLRDALALEGLEGRGNLALDLRSGGDTSAAFTRRLNGTVGLQLKDGSLGLNLSELLHAGLAQLGKFNPMGPRAQPQAATPGAGPGQEPTRWRTPFERMRASFQIDNGVARNQDLDIQAPALRIGGSGTAWLTEQRLDYTLRVTVAPAGLQPAPAEGGALALDSLQGLTVPVQLRGPFNDLQWRIAYADIAPTRQLRKRLRGWAQDSLDNLRNLMPRSKPKE